MGTGTEQNRNKKLINDIGIYAIGNLGSKLITFLMVPLYTYFISDVSDFGYYDLCLSVVFFFVPFVTLQLGDGAFRFLLNVGDDKARQREVLSVTYRTLASMLSLSVVIVLVASMFWHIKYVWLSFGLLCAMSVHDVVSQVARGLGDAKTYVASGILSSVGIGAFSVLFVVFFEWGVSGIFWANILSRVIAIAYIEIKVGVIKKYLSRQGNVAEEGGWHLLVKILKYSLPLVYTTMYWWLINCSDRFFIAHYVGLEQNGIYSVAIRFTAILQTFGFIFYQAWQDTAIKQYHTPDRDVFFSQIFNNYIFYLAVVLVLSSLGLKIFFSWLIAPQYADSFYYIYPCFLAEFFYAMAAFFDLGYQCSKQTRRILPSIYVMTALNILLNILLVPRWELVGVVIASLVSYGLLFVYRAYDTRRYFHIVWKPSAYLAFVILLVGGGIYYCISSPWLLWLFVCGFGVVSFFYLPEKIRTRIKSTLGYEKK